MNHKLLSLHGLKWNPFSPEVPSEALLVTPTIEHFCWRVEQLARPPIGFRGDCVRHGWGSWRGGVGLVCSLGVALHRRYVVAGGGK